MVIGDKVRVNQRGYNNMLSSMRHVDDKLTEIFHSQITGEIVEFTRRAKKTYYRVRFEVGDTEEHLILYTDELDIVSFTVAAVNRRWTMLSALDRTGFFGNHAGYLIQDMSKSSVDELIAEYREFKPQYHRAVVEAHYNKDWKRAGMLKAYCGAIQYAIVSKADAQGWTPLAIEHEIINHF